MRRAWLPVKHFGGQKVVLVKAERARQDVEVVNERKLRIVVKGHGGEFVTNADRDKIPSSCSNSATVTASWSTGQRQSIAQKLPRFGKRERYPVTRSDDSPPAITIDGKPGKVAPYDRDPRAGAHPRIMSDQERQGFIHKFRNDNGLVRSRTNSVSSSDATEGSPPKRMRRMSTLSEVGSEGTEVPELVLGQVGEGQGGDGSEEDRSAEVEEGPDVVQEEAAHGVPVNDADRIAIAPPPELPTAFPPMYGPAEIARGIEWRQRDEHCPRPGPAVRTMLQSKGWRVFLGPGLDRSLRLLVTLAKLPMALNAQEANLIVFPGGYDSAGTWRLPHALWAELLSLRIVANAHDDEENRIIVPQDYIMCSIEQDMLLPVGYWRIRQNLT